MRMSKRPNKSCALCTVNTLTTHYKETRAPLIIDRIIFRDDIILCDGCYVWFRKYVCKLKPCNACNFFGEDAICNYPLKKNKEALRKQYQDWYMHVVQTTDKPKQIQALRDDDKRLVIIADREFVAK